MVTIKCPGIEDVETDVEADEGDDGADPLPCRDVVVVRHGRSGRSGRALAKRTESREPSQKG